LGIDLGDVRTRSTLREGIMTALELSGMEIRPRS
jgi:hypothetical protein